MSAVLTSDQASRTLRARWPIWGILAVTLMLVFFQRVAPGAVADQIMAEFGISGAVFGGLTSLYFYVYALMQLPSGMLADSIGARKVVTIGGLLGAIGSLVFAAAPNLPTAYLGRFLIGLGLSVIMVNIMKLQTEWFRAREFATISGGLVFAANCGALLGTTPLALLAAGVGWRPSFALIGLAGVGIALVSWVIVRNRPADLGLPSIRDVEELEHGEPPLQQPAAPRAALITTLRMVIGRKHIWPPFIAAFGFYGSFVTFAGVWGIPFLMQVYGMQRAEAANYTLLATLGFMAGSFTIGFQSDRIFRRRKLPFVVYGLAYALLWLAFPFWNGGRPPEAVLLPLCTALGFFSGAQALVAACTKEVAPPQGVGMAMGLSNIGPFLGGALLQPLFGWALDLRWEGLVQEGARVYPLSAFQLAFIVGSVFVAVGVLGTLLIKETYCRDLG